MLTFKLVVLFMGIAVPASCQEALNFWGYNCKETKCTKVKLTEDNVLSAVSLPTCRLYCGNTLGTVWPKPTGNVKIEPFATSIRTKIKFSIPSHTKAEPLWRMNKRRFKAQIESKVPDKTLLRNEGITMTVKIIVNQSSAQAQELPTLGYDTDESYSLEISSSADEVVATIKANSFFGARHGLETLSQLIVYDELRQEILILGKVEITDAPVYKHRGLLLDTGRNYFSIKSLKRTLDAMAMTKLNAFHWHIVDATSFPLVIKSQPDLHTIGAYSPRKVYTHEDIDDLVEYGRARGVRVFPDFDSPGHAGEGWQIKNMTVCFNVQPWKYYCPLPPCGQLDPTNEEVYSVLEDIYREMFEAFDFNVFHMGGSQVMFQCWKNSEKIRNWMTARGWGLEDADYVKLWGYFQAAALAKIDKVSGNKKVDIIVYSNTLSEIPYMDKYISNSRYIIQMTTSKNAVEIKNVLDAGYRVILTTHDAFFLDCGFASTVDFGNNWCSPYIGWQKIYETKPEEIAGSKNHLVLGAEAANWSEQLDEHTLDARFWPRSSALAERMWSNPKENWRAAEARMLVHRARLVENGIAPETIQPEWCLQNQDECPRL